MSSVQKKETSGNDSRLFRWRDVIRDADLTPKAKLVALDLSLFMNHDGEAWPSVVRIARETNLSESSVRRALQELKEAKVLDRIKRGGGGRSSRYLALIPGEKTGHVAHCSDAKGSQPDHLSDEKRSHGPGKAVTVPPELVRELEVRTYSDKPRTRSEENTANAHSPLRGSTSAGSVERALGKVPESWSDTGSWRATITRNLDIVQQDIDGDDAEREVVADHLRERFDAGALKPSEAVVREEWRRVREEGKAKAWEQDPNRDTWGPLLIEAYDLLGVSLLANPTGPPPRLRPKPRGGLEVDPDSIREAALSILRRDSLLRQRYLDRLINQNRGVCLRCEADIEGIGVCEECSDHREAADGIIEGVRQDVVRSLAEGRLLAPWDVVAEWPEEDEVAVGA